MKDLLTAKLAVMEKVRRVEKTRQMSGGGNYKYAGAEDIIAEIRPAMVVNKLSLNPCKSEMLVNDRLQMAGGKTLTHVIIKTTFRLSHESGQYEEIESIGEGADSMDKAANKAQTAALKYALLQTFLLQGAHDDPDDYASQEQEPTQQARPEQPKAAVTKTTNGKAIHDNGPSEIASARLRYDASLKSLNGPMHDSQPAELMQQAKYPAMTHQAFAFEENICTCKWLFYFIPKATEEDDIEHLQERISRLRSKIDPSWYAKLTDALPEVHKAIKNRQRIPA